MILLKFHNNSNLNNNNNNNNQILNKNLGTLINKMNFKPFNSNNINKINSKMNILIMNQIINT